jgi:DNA mismatch repair protein MSH6
MTTNKRYASHSFRISITRSHIVSQLVFLYKLVDGVASGSFGTHVANLAGVPMDVVKRAEIVSEDFARKFKDRLEGRQQRRLPLVGQADFTYLVGLAAGKLGISEDSVRRREVLVRMKKAVKRCMSDPSNSIAM